MQYPELNVYTNAAEQLKAAALDTYIEDDVDDFYDEVKAELQTQHVESETDDVQETVDFTEPKMTVSNIMEIEKPKTQTSVIEQQVGSVADSKCNTKYDINEDTCDAQGVLAITTDTDIVVVDQDETTVKFEGGEVKTHTEVDDITYPCIWLETETMPAYKATALQALVSNGSFNADVNVYPVYLKMLSDVIYIGNIDSNVLKELLNKNVFECFKKSIKLNATQEITGTMMYAMCSCS